MKCKSLLVLLLLSWCLSGWSQDSELKRSAPDQGDTAAQQAPAQADNAPQDAGPPPQGGDFANPSSGPVVKVPTGVILVKGAWASSSDSLTPEPEGGVIVDNVYRNKYFGLSWSLPSDWLQKFEGPPPSDSGAYVLAQLAPADTFKGPTKGTVLVTAQDVFFSILPAKNALEMVKFKGDNLPSIYQLERKPEEVTVAGRSFVTMEYKAPVAGLHWYVLATQIRCHAVQFTLTSRDPALLEGLIQAINQMELPEGASASSGKGGGQYPVCIRNYASGPNLLSKVDPILPGGKYNQIPVRITIGKTGRVEHVHIISAFPDQAKIITDALLQWEFKPYEVNGEAFEVETGVLLGRGARNPAASRQAAKASD